MPISPSAIDLTLRPPRSPRVKLGGLVILPRMLDKGRATILGKNGEYNYACPLDNLLLEFIGIDPVSLKDELARGLGDNDILLWIQSNSNTEPSVWEIETWSRFQEMRVPDSVDSREFFHGVHRELASSRQDIATWFDLLDLDDYVSFGGLP